MTKSVNKTEQKTYRELLRERVIHLTPISPESARFQYYLEYDLRAVERGKETAKTLKRFLNLDGLNILDLGCGTGGLAIAFSQEGAHVVGLDPDKSVCHLAQIRAKEMQMPVDFIIADGSANPLRNSSFHLVTCNHVFEHVKNKDKFAHEINRVLKGGGVLYITASNKASPWNILWDEHTGLPLVTLLPRTVQNMFVKLAGLSERGLPFILEEPTYKSVIKTFSKVDILLDDKILKKDIAGVVFSSQREILLSARSNRFPELVNLLTRILKWFCFVFRKLRLSNFWWLLLESTYPLLTFIGRKKAKQSSSIVKVTREKR